LGDAVIILNSITRRHLIAGTAGLIAGTFGASAFGKMRARTDSIVKVRASKGATNGTLHFKGREYQCVLGRSGIVHPKVEGDGGTPSGMFPLREVRYRADRVPQPKTGLLTIKTNPTDGWCDAPADPAYNRLVRMPYQSDAEVMWRDDNVYDVLAVIGYNDAPPIRGAGSAIFLHVARADVDGTLLPTAGCIAMKENDLLAVLAGCKLGIVIDIRTT
jgi:L,D-peptidoglycan transpeptidase YkuD (ErfK/YbiS/YcfS/YnhG family)